MVPNRAKHHCRSATLLKSLCCNPSICDYQRNIMQISLVVLRISYLRIFFVHQQIVCNDINPFWANVPILYPLKTPENQRWYKMRTFARTGLISIHFCDISKWFEKHLDPVFLNPFLGNVPFSSPWKDQKNKDFLIFSGGVKREHWEEKGSCGNLLWEARSELVKQQKWHVDMIWIFF